MREALPDPKEATQSGVMVGMAVADQRYDCNSVGGVMKNSKQFGGAIAQPVGTKIVDLASFRRDRSVNDWVLAFSAVGFCVLSGMFAAKVAALMGAGGLHALIQWLK